MNDLLAVVRRAGPDRLLFVEEYLVRRGRSGSEHGGGGRGRGVTSRRAASAGGSALHGR